MDFEETLELNSAKPRKALLYKAMMESQGAIEFYKEQLEKDKRKYWSGKILHQTKQKKLIAIKLKEVYGTIITNP